MVDARAVRNFYLLCCLAALAACSNGRGSVDSEPPPTGGAQESFTVSGTVAGLDGDGLVLQLNDGNDLAVSNNGSFTFNTRLADDAAYSVEVLTQPTGPSQTCTVGSGTGAIDAANVTNVTITCATGAFALRGAVSGLVGTGLVLQNNGVDELPISNDGEFQFPTPYASGAGYNVTVKTQPSGPSQSCTVANGVGTIGSADVTNVTVSCATGTFSIGVTVSGLAGTGLVLRNNGRNDLSISGNGSFQFSELLASGAMYDVTSRNAADESDTELRRRQRFWNCRGRERRQHHRHLHDEQLHDRRADHRAARHRPAAAAEQWAAAQRPAPCNQLYVLDAAAERQLYVVDVDSQSEHSGARLRRCACHPLRALCPAPT